MNEPNYRLTNAEGQVVGEIGVDGNGNPVVSNPGGGSVTVTDSGIETPSVSTENLQHTAETPQNESSNRNFDTWYQNTTNYSLMVYVTVDTPDGSNPDFRLNVNSSQVTSELSTFRLDGVTSGVQRNFVQGLVPPGDYYQIQDFGGGSIRTWKEQRIGVRQ